MSDSETSRVSNGLTSSHTTFTHFRHGKIIGCVLLVSKWWWLTYSFPFSLVLSSQPRKLGRHSGASITMGIRVPHEDFALQIRERLMAVSKDRDAMTQKVRDLARQKGQTFDEIMAEEWFELPEARKYLLTCGSPEPGLEAELQEERNGIDDDEDNRPPSPRLTISPSELTPRSISLNGMGVSHLHASSGKRMKEVEEAVQNMRINNQVGVV